MGKVTDNEVHHYLLHCANGHVSDGSGCTDQDHVAAEMAEPFYLILSSSVDDPTRYTKYI